MEVQGTITGRWSMAGNGVDNGWRQSVNVKRYRCGHCGKVYRTSTNHWGTIYRGCDTHYYGNSSDCVEAEEYLKEKAR
jgi:hypothetical protein